MKYLRFWVPASKAASSALTDAWLVLLTGILNEITLLVPLGAALSILSLYHDMPLGYFCVYYGYTRLIRALFGLLFGGVDDLPFLAMRGEIDSYLVIPLNWLVAISARRVDMSRVGAVIVSAAVLASGSSGLRGWPMLIVLVPISVVLLAAIHVVMGLLSAFWLPDPRNTLGASLERTMDFYQYPDSIFGLGLRAILYALPPVLIAYWPVRALQTGKPLYLAGQITVGCLLTAVVYWFAELSRIKYQSAGGASGE